MYTIMIKFHHVITKFYTGFYTFIKCENNIIFRFQFPCSCGKPQKLTSILEWEEGKISWNWFDFVKNNSWKQIAEYTVWKLLKFTVTHLWENFVKITFLLKSWFDEIFFSFFHTVLRVIAHGTKTVWKSSTYITHALKFPWN